VSQSVTACAEACEGPGQGFPSYKTFCCGAH